MTEPGGGLILAGDIGGTKTYIGLFRRRGAELDTLRQAKVSNADYGGVGEIISAFLKEGESARVEGACFGIACPVVGGRCTLTNLNWVVDGEAIKRGFAFRRFGLINDLAAMAWGVDLIPEESLHTLSGGVEATGNRALLAAGTGLGQAHLFWDGARHLPAASEGGHGDFAPRDDLEIELLRFLMKKFGHVSYERILSGPGLENVYEFVRSRSGHAVPERLEAGFASRGAASVIAEEAIEGTDEDCRAALDIFISVYGAEAGNMALRGLAMGGLYVGGGIAPRIIKALDGEEGEGGRFISSFLDKGRFREFLRKVPVRVIMKDNAALLGAASAAVHLCSGGSMVAERVIGGGGAGD
ncbi:MAG: glucokinase [Thermodesulfobacteriota bacterium]